MEENKIDKLIADKLKNRDLTTSPSAWERLSTKLDEQEVKHKPKYYKYVAAAIVLLIGLTVFWQLEFTSENKKEIAVVKKGKEEKKKRENRKEKREKREEKGKVSKEDGSKKTIKKITNEIFVKEKKIENRKERIEKRKEKREIIDIDKGTFLKKEELNKDKTNSRIKVNANDLLYAVTHTSEENKIYYAKLKMTRTDVLDTIKKELKLINLNISPETILAEVEQTIEAEEFDNGFIHKLKLKISDIADAVADRNK